MQKHVGFSLLELLVTLALLTLLVMTGLPLLRNSIHASRVTTEVNAMVRAVHVARSEAVKRAGQAVICPSLDGTQCAPDIHAWNTGWLVFANSDNDSPAQVDEDEDILVYHPVSPGILVRSNRVSFAFRTYLKRSSNGTLIFCPAVPGSEARAVVISYTGRPRTAYRRSNGSLYVCTR